jgi:hypothetical protein
MWGWLIVLMWGDVPGKRPLRHTIAAILATSLIGLQLFLLTDWGQVIIFGGTAVFAFIIHLAWRMRLQDQINQEKPYARK